MNHDPDNILADHSSLTIECPHCDCKDIDYSIPIHNGISLWNIDLHINSVEKLGSEAEKSRLQAILNKGETPSSQGYSIPLTCPNCQTFTIAWYLEMFYFEFPTPAIKKEWEVALANNDWQSTDALRKLCFHRFYKDNFTCWQCKSKLIPARKPIQQYKCYACKQPDLIAHWDAIIYEMY